MKPRVILAFLLLLLGLACVTDWIIFSSRKENESLEWYALKAKYVQHFPGFLQPLVQNAVLFTFICLLCFLIAGLILVKQKSKVYLAIAVFCFLMASWQLFSLM